ncbi:MAG: glycosyltransferase family 4 protein [Gammaproteobacteria bacterium]|nr:glycosyltransferase family 4 protein [Gammaproteobacteria bacterium]MBP9729501.1 glycosyltransferase family 4 protein [Gammaproteobacteria bacterium]
MKQKKILYFVAEADYFCSHRLHIALAALKASYQVALITRCNTAIQKKLEAFGITVFPLHHFKRGGFNPFHQIRSLLEIYSVYKRYKPDIVHQVALKPVIFGSWIANICGVPRVINALPGLGYLFTDASQVPEIPPPAFAYAAAGRPPFRKGGEGIKKIGRTLVLRLFKRIFATPNSILILQNTDDQNYLIQQGAIRPEQSVIIPGAGVALDHYKVTPFPPAPPLRIVCIARLLWDKGIGELTEAARILKAAGHPCEMILYGRPDPENPSSILEATLQAWEQAGLLRWAGHCEDVAAAYASAHIAVLPSYREGLPKSLLEAASCGRPIVTTDVPGCRAMVQALVHSHATSGLVQEGENGFLVPAQDPTALAQALARLIENPELRTRMGLAGRKCVEQSFSEQLVQKQTLTLYQ